MGADVSSIATIHMSLGENIRTYLISYLYILGGLVLIVTGLVAAIVLYVKHRRERELNEVDAVAQDLRTIKRLAAGASEKVTLPAYPIIPSQEPYPATKTLHDHQAGADTTLLLEQFIETQVLAPAVPTPNHVKTDRMAKPQNLQSEVRSHAEDR